jgi:phosphoribosylformylglycinamidine synthase
MPQPRVLILRAPGTNCDQETAFAFATAGATAETLHVNRVLESPAVLDRFQILCIPGGFSFGDDVAAGQILAVQMRHHLAGRLADFKAAGKLILGICNGFQVIIKSGILLDDEPPHGPPATLTYNDSGKYEDRWVRLGVAGEKCVFLRGIERMYLPVAHGEGKFIARDAAALARLEAAGQLALRYVPLAANGEQGGSKGSGHGGQGSAVDTQYSVLSTQCSAASGNDPSPAAHLPFPDNPNGSMADVAGVCDTTGRVLGLMPHPERHLDPTHHPRWTRGEAGPVGDGLQVFTNAVRYFE